MRSFNAKLIEVFYFELARTVEALLKLIGKLLKSFAREQCVNYFSHAGYHA